MEKNQNYKQKLVFFLRHGDRGDHSEELYERQKNEKPHDCHLTDLGCLQAQEAGKKMIEIIRKQDPNIQKVKLVSSAYLRCIMTAENVSKGTGLEVLNNQILIDNSIGELTLDCLFDSCPYEAGLHLRENPPIIHDKYGVNLRVVDENPKQDIPKFPEGSKDPDCRERIVNGLKKITQEFFNQVDNGEIDNCALAIFTHGGCIGEILNYFGIFDKEISFPFTNINALLYENKEQEDLKQMPKIIVKQEFQHLQLALDQYQKQKQQNQI